MKLILAIDTTNEFGSIAVAREHELIEEVPVHAPDGFGAILFDRIERLLDRCGIGLKDIHLYAAASGPGSFTGVRIGLACVKGLAEAMGKQAVAVSNLAALAEYGMSDRRATVIDARRGQIYGALYGAEGKALVAESVSRFPDFLATLPDGPVEFLSTDFEPFRASLAGTRFANATITMAPRAQAAAIARIAARRLASGDTDDPSRLDANYVRRSEAELLWSDRST
ncbi:MAG: tRNA (adenosine(37)-N6)-threonylcarbamoyltransferase complex dimerization subunit type 1 TsaB [Acidobacteriota bacterium]|nr:tRNA (adenosine(37)-N6)-threonylcarbamoyltransferase complex dimerization subunit type 1 TsaB [Acidobacteriota bacterium]